MRRKRRKRRAPSDVHQLQSSNEAAAASSKSHATPQFCATVETFSFPFLSAALHWGSPLSFSPDSFFLNFSYLFSLFRLVGVGLFIRFQCRFIFWFPLLNPFRSFKFLRGRPLRHLSFLPLIFRELLVCRLESTVNSPRISRFRIWVPVSAPFRKATVPYYRNQLNLPRPLINSPSIWFPKVKDHDG